MTVVAGLHDPAALCLARDDPDVTGATAPRPDDNGADVRPMRWPADMRPIAGQPQLAIQHPEMTTKPPTAPCAGSARGDAEAGAHHLGMSGFIGFLASFG